MKVAIMQPYFFPYLGYFQLIKTVDKYVIYDDVNFIKGGWINRNKLLLNENEFMFNLILSGASPNKLIRDISISENQTKLLKTIESAYKKAPFYSTVFPIINDIVNYKDKNLAKYIGNSLIQLANYLEIKTDIIFSSNIENKDCSLKAQEKVINICTILGATEYINNIGGIDLYQKKDFEKNNLKLYFLKTQSIEYKQFNNAFIPNLSILDVIMFNSSKEINAMLDQYELI